MVAASRDAGAELPRPKAGHVGWCLRAPLVESGPVWFGDVEAGPVRIIPVPIGGLRPYYLGCIHGRELWPSTNQALLAQSRREHRR